MQAQNTLSIEYAASDLAWKYRRQKNRKVLLERT